MTLPSLSTSMRLMGRMLLWGGWLVPALLAWERLLDYLNDDLARLHFTAASLLRPMPDINEAANIAQARQWMVVAAVWLGLAILSGCVERYRARVAGGSGRSVDRGAAAGLQEQEAALSRQLAQLMQQVEACRDVLAGVSASEPSRGERSDEAQSLQRFDRLEQRLAGLEGVLQRGEARLGQQLVELHQRLSTPVDPAAVFGDLARGPMPLLASAGSAEDLRRLKDLVLNLSDLKMDLRLEQRQLRQRLRDLPDAGPGARAQPSRAA
ncbi:MAG: hypothetical protein RLZZ592_2992 [Pseudomonadota bacterium]|jgi:outer membrane murein-binding lipoprotein Lpp|nr:hypothetical protein [Pseudomonadota bacterium]